MPSSPSASCFPRTEYFIAGTEPKPNTPTQTATATFRIVRPSEGLQLACDPRIPVESQAFEWVVDGVKEGERVRWVLDGEEFATTKENQLLWHVTRGAHVLEVHTLDKSNVTRAIDKTHFLVK